MTRKQYLKAPDDVADVPFAVDIDQSPDFRWAYFSGLAFNGLALATRMQHAEEAWLQLNERASDGSDIIKEVRRDLATLEARIRDNLSADTIKEHGGNTKDERLAYVKAIVAGNPEVQEKQRELADYERRAADIKAAIEKEKMTWQRLDRALRFFERLVGALSTFAPASVTGQVVLEQHVPIWQSAPGLPEPSPDPELPPDLELPSVDPELELPPELAAAFDEIPF